MGREYAPDGSHIRSLRNTLHMHPNKALGDKWRRNEIAYKQECRLLESWARVGFISVPSKEVREQDAEAVQIGLL